MDPIRVLIAAETPLLREGVARLLAAAGGFEIVGETWDAARACHGAVAPEPDVVLLDEGLASGAADAVRRIHAQLPNTRLIVLADSPSECSVAVASGADDCVPKTAGPQSLVEAIRAVASGSAPRR